MSGKLNFIVLAALVAAGTAQPADKNQAAKPIVYRDNQRVTKPHHDKHPAK
jgi:hypothetical protein